MAGSWIVTGFLVAIVVAVVCTGLGTAWAQRRLARRLEALSVTQGAGAAHESMKSASPNERIAATLSDLAERAEEARSRSLRDRGALVDLLRGLPGGTAVFNRNQRLTDPDPLELPGPASSDDPIGEPPDTIWPEQTGGDFARFIEAHLDRCLASGNVGVAGRSLPGATGSPMFFEYTFIPLRDLAGDVDRVVVLGEDVSAHARAESVLEESRERLRQAEKLEAIGRLAGGVAHDFNNLLTVIRGHGQLGLSELADADPVREDLIEVLDAADRASALTAQLLAFSRKREADRRPVELTGVVIGAEKMLKRLIGEDIDLQLRLGDDVPAVVADPTEIEQILLNLAVNARDAMPEGGSLLLSTSAFDAPGLDEELWPGVALGRAGVISVEDTGTGMDEETLAQVFEPFFTTKSVDRGTGLGLATVHEIVQESGGFIEVDSTPGRGTCFRIFLPAARDRPAADEPRAPSVLGRGRGERILVVEDDVSVRAVIVRILERYGYSVSAAADPREAVRTLQASPEAADLVLTDLVMPEMDGVELARILERSFPDLPVILMSGYSDDVLASHGVSPSEERFLPKPFAPELLTARVRRSLDALAGTSA